MREIVKERENEDSVEREEGAEIQNLLAFATTALDIETQGERVRERKRPKVIEK